MATDGLRIEPVTDSRDPRVAAFLSIRDRDLSDGHGGRFIIEGKVSLATFLEHGRFAPESLLVCETRLRSLQDMVCSLGDDIPVYVAPQGVMDDIAGFHVHRGILACGKRGTSRQAAELLPARGPSTILILCGLSNHDNVGGCFRNAAAFGADAILLDSRSCDPLYRKAIRVSAGNTLRLPFSHSGSGEELIGIARAAGYDIWALTPAPDAPPISAAPRPERIALVLGSEGPGLPAELIARARPVRIPMIAGFDSINVATAAAIALSHIFGTGDGN